MFIAGIVVMSLDGCLTRHAEPGTGFASAADHTFFRDALRGFDCSIAGRKTFEAGRESILRAREGSRLQMILTSTPAHFAAEARPGHLEFRDQNLTAVVRELKNRGCARCAVVGGASLYREACSLGLLDELWITVEPLAFGEGVRMFDAPVDFAFALLSFEALSPQTLLLRYGRAVKP